MEKRRLGRTDHMSSIITFGCCALGRTSQKKAEEMIEFVMSHGVNHFDVAPTYGEAELRLRPWMKKHRDEIFLACKTEKRKKKEAAEELKIVGKNECRLHRPLSVSCIRRFEGG